MKVKMPFAEHFPARIEAATHQTAQIAQGREKQSSLFCRNS